MIVLEKLQAEDSKKVLALELSAEQVKFAGTVQDFLSDESATTHLHIIKHDNKVVGFFKLDVAYFASYDFCPEDGIGFRAFAIDKNQQGQGIGSATISLLFAYIKRHYPEFNSVYLTVNCKNTRAKTCYLKGGFDDTGKTCDAGVWGAQHIMCARLT